MPHSSRRHFLRLISSSAAIAAFPSATLYLKNTFADEPSPANEASTADLLTPKILEVTEKGLKYLAGRQQDDGSFGSGGYTRNVGVAALGGMALLSSGSTPGRGPYGKHLNKCINFLLEHTEDSGFVAVAGAPSFGPMYGHGFATLFLAECYGMTPRTDLRKKLSKSVELIVSCQNAEGGWRYQPVKEDADISVTICQIMALRAARNAGLHVPTETVTRCVEYVKRCQMSDGGFAYMLSQGNGAGGSAFPRSAAGVVALHSAGIYEGPEITKGLAYLMSQIPKDEEPSLESHFFYGHYYAVQAMWQTGGEHWAKWYPAIRDTLIKRQQTDGSWMDPICNEYGTAMACIILQMPNNYLPIFHK